jgi:hypothetical protein
VVATANLAEAEGRTLKKSVYHVGLVLAALVATLGMVLTSFGLALAALWRGLTLRMDGSWAYLICAGVCLALAAGLAWLTMRIAK